MLCYQCHLGLRDSDKLTFENRVREAIKWTEKNHPGYRVYMLNNLGIDRYNCTAELIPNLRDLAPMYVLSHAQWGCLAAAFVLLNSRCGCILSAVHALWLMLFHNMYNVRPYFHKFLQWHWRHGTHLFKKTSPCLPRKEFEETEMHIDKCPDCFN